jgi:putative flippase GtrA
VRDAIIQASSERARLAFIRYTLTGGVATAVHYAVLLALVEWLGVPAPWAAGVGALCGAALGYLGNRHFTFQASGASHCQAVPRFLAVALAGAALNGLIVWLGTQLLGWHYLAAQVLATLVVLGLGYRLNRSWTFA